VSQNLINGLVIIIKNIDEPEPPHLKYYRYSSV